MKTSDAATRRGFESHSLRQKSAAWITAADFSIHKWGENGNAEGHRHRLSRFREDNFFQTAGADHRVAAVSSGFYLAQAGQNYHFRRGLCSKAGRNYGRGYMDPGREFRQDDGNASAALRYGIFAGLPLGNLSAGRAGPDRKAQTGNAMDRDGDGPGISGVY